MVNSFRFTALICICLNIIFFSCDVLTKKTSKQLCAIGTYTTATQSKGIYIVELDLEKGILTKKDYIDDIADPSFLVIDKQNQYVYVVSEVAVFNGGQQGGLFAYQYDNQFKFNLVDSSGTGGADPCHLFSTDKTIAVANYTGGNISFFDKQENGVLGSTVKTYNNFGKGTHSRQEAPHAHYVGSHPLYPHIVYGVDLGADKIMHYDISDRNHIRLIDSTFVGKGSGPRHLAFHYTLPFCYLINELNSTITTFKIDGESSKLVNLETIASLPKNWQGENYPSGIIVHPNNRFLYALNRGKNSISVFAIRSDGSQLHFIGGFSSEGNWPRSLNLTPDGKWMLVANQKSDNVAIFRVNEETGLLEGTELTIKVPAPTHVDFF